MPNSVNALRTSDAEDRVLKEVAQIISFASQLRAALDHCTTEAERVVLSQARASVEATHRDFGLPESMMEQIPPEQVEAFMT